MNYTVEKTDEFQILCVSSVFHASSAKKEIPLFWDEYYKRGYGEVACGQFAYCFDEKPDGTFRYAIGNRCTIGKEGIFHIFNRPDRTEIPKGFEVLTIPAQLWLRVECRGPLPHSIQQMIPVIQREWPEELERVPGGEIEEYGYCTSPEDSQKEDYCCFIRIPVRFKEPCELQNKVMFRTAVPEDIETILGFIRDLAEYEKMADQVVATPEMLKKWMFDRKTVEAQLAITGGKAVGFAIYFYNFSTWLGRAGIYIEDVYVRPEYRKRGIGRALFRRIARKAVAEGCGRMEWWCLKWNQPSLKFYRTLGAVQMEEWMPLRLTGKALLDLAGEHE